MTIFDSEPKYTNTLVCSFRVHNLLERAGTEHWPEWLLGCRVISDSHCSDRIAYHFDAKGKMRTFDSSHLTNTLPEYPQFDSAEDMD